MLSKRTTTAEDTTSVVSIAFKADGRRDMASKFRNSTMMQKYMLRSDYGQGTRMIISACLPR